MKKVVLKVNLHDDKAKNKAMKMVSSICGIDSISMDMKEEKLTVIGDEDPIQVVRKLRKFWHAEILTVGPAKEPEKKGEEEKKKKEEEEKKKKKEEEDKKKKKEEEDKKKKEEEEKKKKDQSDQISEVFKFYKDHNYNYNYNNRPYYMPTYYYVPSAEENPNACVIC